MRKLIILLIALCLIFPAQATEKVKIIGPHFLDVSQDVFILAHNNKSPRHGSHDFEGLVEYKQLRVLDLAHNNITDISFLAELPELRILLLGDNQISDLTPLASLKHLEYLELFKNKITDLSPLRELPLLDLNIGFNYIEDLSPLADIQTLERLWMFGCQKYNRQPDDESVVALQLALPKTIFETSHYPTLEGWREHPRWYVIRNMTRRAYKWLPWGSDGYTQDFIFVPGNR